jgi:hypothetical protein
MARYVDSRDHQSTVAKGFHEICRPCSRVVIVVKYREWKEGFENGLVGKPQGIVDKFPMNDVEWLGGGTSGT